MQESIVNCGSCDNLKCLLPYLKKPVDQYLRLRDKDKKIYTK